MVVGFGNLAKGQCPCDGACNLPFCIVNTTCDTITWWATTTCCGEVPVTLEPNVPFCGACTTSNDACPGGSCITGLDLTASMGSGGTITSPALGPWDWPSYGNVSGYYLWPLGCTQCNGTGINITWTGTTYVISCDH